MATGPDQDLPDQLKFTDVAEKWAAESGKELEVVGRLLLKLVLAGAFQRRRPSDVCREYAKQEGRDEACYRVEGVFGGFSFPNIHELKNIIRAEARDKVAKIRASEPDDFEELHRLKENAEFSVVTDQPVERSAFLRACREFENDTHYWPWPDSELVAAPTFWGDPWAGEPADWLDGYPGFPCSKFGLSLKDARKRFSDPGDWAEYEEASNPESKKYNIDHAQSLLAKLQQKLEQNLQLGRLVVRGYDDAGPQLQGPFLLQQHLIPCLVFDYQHSTAALGSRRWVGLRVFRPEDAASSEAGGNQQGATGDSKREEGTFLHQKPDRGRPSCMSRILDKERERLEHGETSSTPTDEARWLESWTKQHIDKWRKDDGKNYRAPKMETIRKEIKEVRYNYLNTTK